jgi:carbamoyl-phosphate synthase large subunit
VTYKKYVIHKVVILGSGGLRIGQAGEFDYSGSQAIKALKEEHIETVLINPNIATVQTDSDMADRVYFVPLTTERVTQVLEKERPEAILLSFGGQTALNLGLALHDSGTLQRLNIRVLGTSVSAIKITEDRNLFKNALQEINVNTARSIAANNLSEAKKAARKIGYPIMLRSGFSLGGLGSGRIESEDELVRRVGEVMKAVPQVLIEEYLVGWKEIEYEVVRDVDGNTITVCNMENFDPMGVHTGESIVVAPSQTLTNEEYYRLRKIAIETINYLGIIGECNIQYALHPITGEYRVIEVNARLSRSSALASKATGYPLAFVATKLVLGKKLHELKNSTTGITSAFFEPALDYVAVKMPRWDLTKLKSSEHEIGSEMKSVGEVMALGRSFPEALQKAIRMLNIGANGLSMHSYSFKNPMNEVKHPTDRRLFAIYEAFKRGKTVQTIHAASHIDKWFLEHVSDVVTVEQKIRHSRLSSQLIKEAKQKGFADKTIAALTGLTEKNIRDRRIKKGIIPIVKQIDTLAGEFDAQTNYLYMTYNGAVNDVKLLSKKTVAVIGSGPYCIGSSVEFDWCAVNTAKALHDNAYQTIMINSNPETVSTDFDRSDRLYFEELTLERVQDIADFEKPLGLVVSVGGQIANNLALPLRRASYPIIGTDPLNIDRAEDRQKFSSMLVSLGIDQPAWEEVTSLNKAKQFASKIGFPILIRPSYVLSGGAMNVVRSEEELKRYLQEAALLSPDYPVVMSQFISNAKEFEIDGVAQNGKLIIYAISEHIENAGIHSGDATVVFPAQQLYLETVRRAKRITKQVIKNLNVTGPFNIQFIAKENAIKVIECNVRASRSFPFVSKVLGHNFITIATEAMLGKPNNHTYQTLELERVAVKTPLFSYNRLKGADPVAGVEMASTGEVACFGDTLSQAFYSSWLATEQQVKGKRLFVSLPDEHKHKVIEETAMLQANGWHISATKGTHDFLKRHGIVTTRLYKIHENKEPSVATAIKEQKVDIMLNVPSLFEADKDAYKIRRLAIDNHIPLITNAETGKLLLKCLGDQKYQQQEPKSWDEYVLAVEI